MFSAQNRGFQGSRAHVRRRNEFVDVDEGIVCAEGYIDLTGYSPKDTVQIKRANKVQSYQKARKNDPSIFNILPTEYWSRSNTRLIPLAPTIVKQHLRRRHGADSSSPVGQKGPRSLHKVEDNVREEGRIGSLDTIPPHILDDLKIRSDRRTSSTAQWHQIWVLLFGESKFTPNPLLNGLVKEITGMIRDIWSKEGGQLVSNYLHTRGIPLDSGQLLSLLPELLDKFEGRFEGKPVENDSDEQHAGIESPPLENAIGGTDVSHESSETPIQYPFPELGPLSLIPVTSLTSTACNSPQSTSGVQVPHDFASIGGAFESQANSSEYAGTDFSNTEQSLYMDILSPADDPCDITIEGPLSEMAEPRFHPDWHGLPNDYYFKFLEE
ncbi:hypothetical protein FNAPI_5126 [Fusarium napiforme]|uniref:Uncharacterized protein n=1 Tax=Fusarium napiforme TaxID=42672 RepID=A0A8H5JMM1_9HYPO|nr:hypothetical protein FNAPI_5126 [Fusarium napiforme]